jgi:hypothetical protein
VAKDLKLTGLEETFDVEVSYDTLELYGKISAHRSVMVYRQ